jgi:hypothetical protein
VKQESTHRERDFHIIISGLELGTVVIVVDQPDTVCLEDSTLFDGM